MIILNDNLDKNIRKQILKIMPKKSLSLIHGTFASKKSSYISDVDLELLFYFEKISKETKKKYVNNIIDIINLIKHNDDIFFINSIIGIDNRFDLFDIYINEDFTFKSFDTKKFIKEVNKLFKNKVITVKEKNEFLSIMNKKPTRMLATKLKLLIEDDFKYINWTEKELLEGKKKYRNKVFNIEDKIFQEKFPSILNLIFKVNETTYIPIDLSILCYYEKNFNLNLEPEILNPANNKYFKIQNKLLTETDRYTDIHRFFFAIFKNYYQKKWMKCLKRLRTLLTRFFFKECNVNKYKIFIDRIDRDRSKIYKIREDISNLNNTEIGILNQFKNQLNVALDLIGKIKDDKIIKIIKNRIEDIKKCSACFPCQDENMDLLVSYINNNKINHKELKELLKNLIKRVTNCMNQMAYPYFVKYYNKSKYYLPFRLFFEKDFINL